MHIARREKVDCLSCDLRIFDNLSAAVRAYPPELRPVLVVVISEQGDGGIRPDVAKALQIACCLGLLVDDEVNLGAAQGERADNDVRAAARVNGRQPSDSARSEPLPGRRLRKSHARLNYRLTAADREASVMAAPSEARRRA